MYVGLVLLSLLLLAVIIGAMVLSFLSKTEIDKYVSGTDPKGKERAANYAEYASILSGVGLALLLLGFGLAYFYYRSGETFEGMKDNVKYASRKAKAPFQYVKNRIKRNTVAPAQNVDVNRPVDATNDVSHLEGGIPVIDDYNPQ